MREMRQRTITESIRNTFSINILLANTSHHLRYVQRRTFRTTGRHCDGSIIFWQCIQTFFTNFLTNNIEFISNFGLIWKTCELLKAVPCLYLQKKKQTQRSFITSRLCSAFIPDTNSKVPLLKRSVSSSQFLYRNSTTLALSFKSASLACTSSIPMENPRLPIWYDEVCIFQLNKNQPFAYPNI